jgi:NAD(P)-dependent dehydrogenase (short-subunit alcohol dehydrogenase family)
VVIDKRKSVLITGANSGIGLECARQYAQNGYLVYACHLPHAPIDTLNELSKQYQTITTYSLDITDEDKIKKLALALDDKPIDILINNAGIFGVPEQLGDITADCLINTFTVNTVGALLVCKHLINNVLTSDDKTIVCMSTHIASMENIHHIPQEFIDSYGYSASKAAMNMVMAILSTEFAAQDLKVLLIAPGKVHTPMGDTIQPDKSKMYTVVFELDFIDAQTSVQQMRHLIEGVSQNTQKVFLSYDGKTINW